MPNNTTSWIAILSLLTCSACGGAANPEAEAPEAETSAPAPANETGDKPEAEDESVKAPEAEAGSESADSSSSSESNHQRKAVDTLTADNTMFVLSFERSEAGEKAAELCEKFAQKPEKKSACITKERKKITADVLHFVKDDADQWYWITSRQQGTALKKISKLKFDLGKETATSVEVIGKGPGAVTTVIEVLNDYTIALSNPKHGKLVYEAKVALEKK